MKVNMKTLVSLFLSCLAVSAFASEAKLAPAELVAELTAFCQEVAEEDGTNGKPLNVFLLECVNEELESEGFEPVDALR
jgi:hypothetical protein